MFEFFFLSLLLFVFHCCWCLVTILLLFIDASLLLVIRGCFWMTMWTIHLNYLSNLLSIVNVSLLLVFGFAPLFAIPCLSFVQVWDLKQLLQAFSNFKVSLYFSFVCLFFHFVLFDCVCLFVLIFHFFVLVIWNLFVLDTLFCILIISTTLLFVVCKIVFFFIHCILHITSFLGMMKKGEKNESSENEN